MKQSFFPSEMRNANILVTGGCGFIGGGLVKELVSRGAKVTVVDIYLDPRSVFSQNKLQKKTNLKILDIRDRQKVLDFFKKIKPEYIIHLAAQPLVDKAYENPYESFETNIMGTVNILEAARLAGGVRGIIVASSDKAYGKSDKAYVEDITPLKGDHPYDVSKSCEDLIAYSYYKTYNLPIVITRFGNVYGEGDLNFGRIIPDICRSIIKNEVLLIRSDGSFIRDYIYVKDVVSGYIFLLKNIKKVKGEAFNFSSKDTLSVIEVVKKAEKVLKIKIPMKILNRAKNEIPYQHLDDKKIKITGWKPSYSINHTVKDTLEWYANILKSG